MKTEAEIAINRAKEFLSNLPCIQLDESVPFEDYLDFSNPEKPYFVYMDQESCGCFENETSFMTLEEVNDFIKKQVSSGRRGSWDNVCILDVKANKIVEPRVGE